MDFEIIYNGLTLNPTNGYSITNAIGLNGVEIRNSRSEATGEDGAYIWNQKFDGRTMTFSGFITGDNPDDYFSKKSALLSAFAINNTDETLSIQRWDSTGTIRIIEAKVLEQPEIIERNGYVDYNPYQVILFAQSPWFLDNTLQTGIINTLSESGFTSSFVDGFVANSASNTTTIHNTGDVQGYPEITIHGAITNAVVTNVTTGEYFNISTTIGTNESVTVSRSAGGDEFVLLQDGTNYRQYMKRNLFKMALGNNVIRLSGSGSDSNTSLTITYRNHYRNA